MKNYPRLCFVVFGMLAILALGAERHRTNSIRVENNRATITHFWPLEDHRYGGFQQVYFAPTPTGEWRMVSESWREMGDEESEYSQAIDADSPSGFFKVVDVPAQADLWEIDSDYDMLVDAYEMSIGSDPYNSDSDGDGLSDFEENNAGTDPWDPDTDGDGVGDFEEVSLYWNPLSIDSDEDGLNDGDEFYVYGSDGMNPDSDYDGMDDRWEAEYDLNPISEYDADTDPDCDGLTNLEEYLLGTNPRNDDTDCDGMSDGEEVARGRDPLNPGEGYRDSDGDGLSDDDEMWLGTDPENADSDDDGLLDGLEDNIGTNPLDSDSDGDGLEDFWEVMRGLDPLSPDTDNDGMDDLWEVEKGLDPCDGSDRSKDSDGDGLTNFKEYMLDTDPTSRDTDGDGMDDGWEDRHYFDPKLADDGAYDPDGDGLVNRDECRYGTDPQMWDTDGDRLSDGDEVAFGTNPLNKNTLSDRYDDFIMSHSNGRDPMAIDMKSGLTNWQVAFYGTGVNGAVKLPKSSETNAVLVVSVRGSGYGELTVGDETVSLLGSGAGVFHNELRLFVARGKRLAVSVDAPESLDVLLSSADYAIGELPAALCEEESPAEEPLKLKSGLKTALRGGSGDEGGKKWIAFPKTKPTIACIHDLTTRMKRVRLDPGADVERLVCTWKGNAEVEVDNHPPLDAVLKGNFPLDATSEVTYRLEHELYLFGAAEMTQPVRYCPQEDAEEEEEEEEETAGGGSTGGEGTSGTGCCCPNAYCEDPDCQCPCHGKRGEAEEEEPDEESDDGICRVHEVYYRECEHLHKGQYDRNSDLPEDPNVLKLHDPKEYDVVDLHVPPALTNCCECPEHTGRKVCLATSSERLDVEIVAGSPFSTIEEDGPVLISGREPSQEFRDAKVAFSGGGKIVEHRVYTVLGVRIECETDRLADVGEITPVTLVTDVGLHEGDVRLAFRDARGRFRLWVTDEAGTTKVLLDSENSPELNVDIHQWRRLMGRGGMNGGKKAMLMTDEPGSVSLEFGFVAANGKMAVKDVARKTFSNRAPRLVFDYDRNGVIDDDDVSAAREGRVFRFWTNDDADEDEVCSNLDYESDAPGKGPAGNADDAAVNGLRDLVDLTPVWIDLSEILEGDPLVKDLSAIKWSLRSDCVNVVWSDLTRSEAGKFQKSDMGFRFGASLSEPVTSASVMPAGEKMELDMCFAEKMCESRESGVFLIEGACPGSELILEGWIEGENAEWRKVCAAWAKLNVDGVEKMYRWMPLRRTCGKVDLSDSICNLMEPQNRPDAECPGPHVVFVHGFNVNLMEARALGAETFKRLWQSGLEGAFTVADWFGSEGQFTSMAVQLLNDGTASPNYYVNVEHAFMTAQTFADLCRQLPGEKVLLAHSLGNVLASSAVVDYGLAYRQYYMLNAAVAKEAYKHRMPNADESMVDQEWKRVDGKFWAAGWHRNFPSSDFRSTLTWFGRFKGLGKRVNIYSKSDETVGNGTVGQNALFGSVWRAQELLKGTSLWHGLNAVSVNKESIPIEGGWGINTFYAANPRWYVPRIGFLDRVQSLTVEEAKEHPLFTPFRFESERMLSDQVFTIEDPLFARKLQARFLGDAIPAVTPAMGANADSDSSNFDLEALPGGPAEWDHSDMKSLAYRYTYGLFDIIAKTME